MGRIILIALVASGFMASSAICYEFRPASERDLLIAKAATDWLFHDDWGRAQPNGAYSATWYAQIPAMRSNLVERFSSVPVDVLSDTNASAHALLTYDVRSRSFKPREGTVDPWPEMRLVVRETKKKTGELLLWLCWAGSVRLLLMAEEKGGKISVQKIEDMRYMD